MVIVETAKRKESELIAERLRLARTESMAVPTPMAPLHCEKGIPLESAIALQVQAATASVQPAHTALWELIDDSRAVPEEVLQAAISYWSAVRRLRMWLGAYRELHDVTVRLDNTGEQIAE